MRSTINFNFYCGVINMASGDVHTAVINSTNRTFRPPAGQTWMVTFIVHDGRTSGDKLQLSEFGFMEHDDRFMTNGIRLFIDNTNYIQKRGDAGGAYICALEL